jgi:hypothetical protein
MTARYDEHHHQAAAQIQATYPCWLIIWGSYSRRYWAYPRFSAAPGTLIAEPGTRELRTHMDHAERAARLPRPPPPPRPQPVTHHKPVAPGEHQCQTPHQPAATPSRPSAT